MQPIIEAMLPMKLPSGANLREHWAIRAKRVSAQREGAHQAMSCTEAADVIDRLRHGRRYEITLHRIGKRMLDDDNLAYAFKAVRDGIAEALYIDDADPRIQWRCTQSVGRSPAIVISVAEVP